MTARPLFVDVAGDVGLDFTHRNGATGQFYLPELMGSGCAWLDFDNDGYLDAYFAQAGPLPAEPDTDGNTNRLYRNRGDGTFEDVTQRAGVGDRHYGVGVAVADYDRDGDLDLYATNLGRNTLYANNGDGTFTDATAWAGVGDEGYSSSAAFVDYDGDGHLDLYVCNYIAWAPNIERPCHARSGVRDYCGPTTYGRPQADSLFHSNGDGTFTDVSVAAGIRSTAGNGLGLVCADFDGDGRVDIYVANDQMANHLWINQGDGTFRDEALTRGCALNEFGQAEASMGIAAEDVDGDADWDLFMAHMDAETNTYYRNDNGFFQDMTAAAKLGTVSRSFTGFGTSFFDYDCDGHYDIFLANGKVRLRGLPGPNAYAEQNQLLRGTAGGVFEDVTARAGPAMAVAEVSRGAAFADYDDDGDIDILLSNNDGPARLLRNDARGRHHWLSVRLVGRTLDRDGLGAQVAVQAGGRTRTRLVTRAYSYCSSNDARVHFGLGDIETVDAVIVTWPDGRKQQRRGVRVDQGVVFEEPGAPAIRPGNEKEP